MLRHQGGLDRALKPFVPRGLDGVPPPVRSILRLGAYQLRHLERVPPHAAVSTSVDLAKETAGPKSAGFVNAVLRKVAGGASRPAPPTAPAGRTAPNLARRYDHPEWLVERWLARFGPAETEALLQWNNARPRLVLQPARASLPELQQRLLEAGIACTPAPFGAGLLVEGVRPQEVPGYAAGEFFVQDPAQALVVRFAAVPPGATVYDACAAPGGKAMSLSPSAALVVAGEADRRRVGRLRENLARAGASRALVVVADGRHPPVRRVDAVLLDAPCLGTGTLARHPDLRWRVNAAALERITARQRELLEAAAGAVRPGGLLLYATCSLEPEENAEQVNRFLAAHEAFGREPSSTVPDELLSPTGDLMILPQRHGMDGAFAARLRRKAG